MHGGCKTAVLKSGRLGLHCGCGTLQVLLPSVRWRMSASTAACVPLQPTGSCSSVVSAHLFVMWTVSLQCSLMSGLCCHYGVQQSDDSKW